MIVMGGAGRTGCPPAFPFVSQWYGRDLPRRTGGHRAIAELLCANSFSLVLCGEKSDLFCDEQQEAVLQVIKVFRDVIGLQAFGNGLLHMFPGSIVHGCGSGPGTHETFYTITQ